jgi:hypothetical protein
MTDRARLEITFDQRYITGEGCYLITSIDTVVTEPDELDACLVVQRAGVDIEKFVKIAEFVDLSTLPPLPPTVLLFKSATYAVLAPAVGDVIHIGEGSLINSVPPIWKNLHGYLAAHTYTVVDVTTYAPHVLVDSVDPFPDYGREIGFYVVRVDGITEVIPAMSPAYDGEAERVYALADMFYLAGIHHDFLGEIEVGLDFVAARRAESQSIVDDLNADGFTGVFTELYE